MNYHGIRRNYKRNYIDALALVRRKAWEVVGGFHHQEVGKILIFGVDLLNGLSANRYQTSGSILSSRRFDEEYFN